MRAEHRLGGRRQQPQANTSQWEQGDPYAHDYSYDVWGNITQRSGWGGWNHAVSYTYANNRISNPGHTYDAAGNLTNDGAAYAYDATGQQTSAVHALWNVGSGYDGDLLRGKKTENGLTTYYLRSSVLGGQVVAEVNASGVWQRGHVYLGGQLLAVQAGGAVHWQHEDPITKAKALTDATGALTSFTVVDPWGGEASAGWQQNSAQQRRKYTSYERDVHARDEAMRRQYSGWYARFTQPDPSDGSYDPTDPQSLNRYAYTNNDPVNFIDPTGLNLEAPDGSSRPQPLNGPGLFSPGIHTGYLSGYYIEAASWIPVLVPYTYFNGGIAGGSGGGGYWDFGGGSGGGGGPDIPGPRPLSDCQRFATFDGLRRATVTRVAGVIARRIVLLVAEVMREFTVEGAFD